MLGREGEARACGNTEPADRGLKLKQDTCLPQLPASVAHSMPLYNLLFVQMRIKMSPQAQFICVL